MIVFIAGSILTAHHIQHIVVHLLRASGSNKTFPLLGDHIRDISLLGIEVISHRFRFILLIPIFKQGITELFTNRVKTEFGKHQAAVQAHLDILRLQPDLLVFDISFTIQICPVTGCHHHRVFCLINNRSIQSYLLRLSRIGSKDRTIGDSCRYRIPYDRQYGIPRGNQLLRIHHQSPGEEI